MRQKDIAVAMKISIRQYSVFENNDNRLVEKTAEILKVSKYNFESVRNLLNAIPPPKNECEKLIFGQMRVH